MPIKPGTGNLLTQDVDALVNTVNTQGVMGKGIALQFKKAWPEMFRSYQAACRRGEVVPGKVQVWETHAATGPRLIVNFPTKRHWRERSRLTDIVAGLTDLTRVIREFDLRSIAVPPLGCGNGGLDWRDVRPRIEEALEPLADSVTIILFAPSSAPEAAAQPNREQRPALTPARAAMLGVMREYERLTLEPPTLIEVQKLAYFLQLAGEPLRLDFQPAHYGPYADNLRKALRAMEGHFIIGFGDGSAPVNEAEPLRVMPEIDQVLTEYIAAHPETQQRIQDVLETVEGFESTYGLELLATVRWILEHDEAARRNTQIVHDRVQKWSRRKASLFTHEHIEHAWRTSAKAVEPA